MADSQPEPTRESRFSKALVARITAVGLFVALGTTAVVFLMGKPNGVAKSESENPSSSENVATEQPGFTAQVPASFATSADQSSSASFAAPNLSSLATDNQFATFNPTTTPADQVKKEPSQFPSFNPAVDQPKVNPEKDPKSDGSPERYAALDNRLAKPTVPNDNSDADSLAAKNLNPVATLANPKSENSVGLNPIADRSANPNDNKNGQSSYSPTGLTKLNDADGFASRAQQGDNLVEPKTKPVTERIGSEPLKPFTQPDLPNRMIATPEPSAPNLKAPSPNVGDDDPSKFPSQPKSVIDPWNKPVEASTNSTGLLRPFEPPTDVEQKQEPKPISSTQINQFAPISSGDETLSRPMDSSGDSFSGGAANRLAQGNPRGEPSASPDPFQPAASNGTSALPTSVPLSNGSPINQPLSNPNRSSNPTGFGGTALTVEPKTANTPGERRLEGVQAPAITVEKLSPKEVSVNEIADFIVVIRNVGRVDANDVIVHDQVPANTEFQNSNPPPTQNTTDRRLNWDLGTIKAGQEKRIQYQLKPITPGEIGSVAHVTFSTQASMRTLVTQPVLEIVHRSKPVAMIGSDVIFDVVITNKGNGPAKNVLIQEDVPPQLQLQEGFRELEYEVGNLMPGQSKRVQLGLKAVEVGRLKNVIIATASGGQRAQHEIEMEVVAPKLIVTADGPTKRYLGRQVTHQFKLANPGTASATNVDLVAKLPPGLRFVKADNQGVYRQANHAIYWSMAELTANKEVAVELITMPVDIGKQDISFEVIADLNQKASVVQPLNIEHLVDIFFDIDDLVDPIEVGADTAYQIKVANQGTQLANNIQLQVEFPNGILPTAVESNLQNQINGQRVQFAPINNLKPGEQLTVVIRAKGQMAGDHRVVVTLQADGRQTAVAKEEITRVYSDR
jgi:uncharacterized repeat protein (TIGR01451 family)